MKTPNLVSEVVVGGCYSSSTHVSNSWIFPDATSKLASRSCRFLPSQMPPHVCIFSETFASCVLLCSHSASGLAWGGFQHISVLFWLTMPSSACRCVATCWCLSVGEWQKLPWGPDAALSWDWWREREGGSSSYHVRLASVVFANFQSFCNRLSVLLGAACCDWRYCAW